MEGADLAAGGAQRGQVERRHVLERMMELERWVDPSHVGGEVARTPWGSG